MSIRKTHFIFLFPKQSATQTIHIRLLLIGQMDRERSGSDSVFAMDVLESCVGNLPPPIENTDTPVDFKNPLSGRLRGSTSCDGPPPVFLFLRSDVLVGVSLSDREQTV